MRQTLVEIKGHVGLEKIILGDSNNPHSITLVTHSKTSQQRNFRTNKSNTFNGIYRITSNISGMYTKLKNKLHFRTENQALTIKK